MEFYIRFCISNTFTNWKVIRPRLFAHLLFFDSTLFVSEQAKNVKWKTFHKYIQERNLENIQQAVRRNGLSPPLGRVKSFRDKFEKIFKKDGNDTN